MRKVNWGSLAVILSRLDLRWAGLGFTSTAVLIASLALRWQIFLRQQRIVLPFRTTFALTWAGQFFNSLLPGSTGGDVIKILSVCRLAPDRKPAATSTVLVDRFTALVALAVLAGVALLTYPGPVMGLITDRISLRNSVIAVLAGGVLTGAVAIGLARFLRGSRIVDVIVRVATAMRANLVLSPKIAFAGILAFEIHLWNFLTVFLYARALGIPISFGEVLLMMPVILFIVLVPVTINGHGLRELLLIAYFTRMGMATQAATANPQETAVALSLLVVANDLLWSLPGGLFYLLRFSSRNEPGVGDSGRTIAI
ncbi:MAG: flippase-like domain-containing protein [Verrucomicrobiota bacterium]|nr:flippase-like domain-containing protein [Verrucomicrobiota bacterium]